MIRKAMMSLAMLLAGGCAAIRLPPDQLEGSEASIRGAEELGAKNVPAARLELQLAREQTASAKQLAADGDGRALLVLARAQADAELALATAREASVHAEALRASEDLKAVRARGAP